jgi:hypothetical protein
MSDAEWGTTRFMGPFSLPRGLYWAPYLDMFQHCLMLQLEQDNMNVAILQHDQALPYWLLEVCNYLHKTLTLGFLYGVSEEQCVCWMTQGHWLSDGKDCYSFPGKKENMIDVEWQMTCHVMNCAVSGWVCIHWSWKNLIISSHICRQSECAKYWVITVVFYFISFYPYQNWSACIILEV